MTEYNAGEARLRIVPDATGFAEKLKADLKRVDATLAVKVEPGNLAQASADIERWRKLQERNAIKIPVVADEKQFRDSLNKLKNEFEKGSGGAGVLKLNLAEAGISLIPGAVTGIVDLAAALQQLAQAGLAIPGALAGVGASIGTMVVGLGGIKDAYDAISKAAETSATDQASAARAAAQAQNQLRNAAVDDANAHKDLARAYRDARQELQDLNIEARGGQISEQQAINDALKARRDLAKGGFKDQLDYNDALLRVASADQRVVEVHQRNIEMQDRLNEANQKGIDNSDKVAAAQERVVRSGQQLADAQASADLATTKTSAAATAAAQAMAKLGPNAQEFVNTLIALKPVFQDFRTAISQPLLEGMSAEIRNLVDADLPNLQQGMARIAAAINTNLKTLGSSLGSANSQSLLDRILGNTAEAQKRVNAVIDPLVRGVGTLTAAGSDALPRLSDDMAKIAANFATLIEAADKDGRLNKWISDGITGFEHLMSILDNLGSSFLSITRAAGGGEGLLGSLDKVTEKLANFLKSPEGQQQLKDFFKTAREDLEKWRPVLEALPGLFKGVLDASREWTNLVLPPVSKIAEVLGRYPGLLETVVLGFTAFKTLSFASNIITEFNKISDVLGFAGSGKKGAGGKGLLGKLGIAAALLGAIELFDASTNPDGSPKDTPVTPGQINPGGIPVGQPVPFGAVPVLPSGAVGQVAAGAVGGGLTAGAPGAAVGVLATLFTMSPDSKMGPQEKLNSLIYAIPFMPESDIKPIAEAMGISVDQLKGLTRDEFSKRLRDLKVPGFATGGPTPSGRGNGPSGGWLAEVHSDEWVLPAHARAAIGDSALWALTGNRKFADGGFIDPAGNPVTPGAIPGPSVVPAAPVGAPAGGGRLLPGLWGLAQAAGNDQMMQAWQGQTMDWLGGFAQKTLSGFGSALLNGGLSIFGLQQSILSPNNPWFQAAAGVANFAMGSDSPLAGLMGGQGGASVAAPTFGTDMVPLGDGNTLPVPTFGTSVGAMGYAAGQAGNSPGAGAYAASKGGGRTGSDEHLVGNAVRAKHAIEAMFPAITTIGGWRASDPYPDHPSGQAIDIMIPGWNTANGKAYGDSIAAYLLGNSSTFGVDYVLWQQREWKPGGQSTPMATRPGGATANHFDHVHAHVIRQLVGGKPGAYAAGGAALGQGGPHDDRIPAWLSSGEHVLTAEDVAAMGGQENVYKFRNALHRAAGGGIISALIPQPPKPNFDPGPGAQKKAEIPMPAPTKVIPSVPSRGAAPLPPPEPAKLLPAPIPDPAVPADGADVNSDTRANKPNWMPTAGMGAAPTSYDHTLPALSKGIEGAASVIGSIVSMAASAAAAGGTMGASAMAGGMGGSQAGALASSLITQGGKIAAGLANVGSSFLVGSITGGTTPNAYGETLRPYQNVPVTSPGRTQINTFNGMDVPRVFQELDLRNAQDQQASLAHRPVR